MDLIDRYLDSIRLFLPRAERDDILAELKDILMTRREEKAAELGRPLSKAEEEALLHDFGNPIAVAGRYGRQRYLIGPQLYPVWELVMKIVLLAIAASALITAIAVTAGGGGDATKGLLKGLGVLWTGIFTSVGVVTVVFATLERSAAGRTMIDNWKVSDLPRMPVQRRRRRRENWIDWTSAVVVHTLFVLWWVGLIHFWPADIPVEPKGMLRFAFAPELQALYWPVLAVSSGLIAVNLMKLASRETRPIGAALDVVAQLAIIAIAGFALHAGHWVVATGVGVPDVTMAKTMVGVNIGAEVTLIVVIVSAVMHLVMSAWRRFGPGAAAKAATNGA